MKASPRLKWLKGLSALMLAGGILGFALAATAGQPSPAAQQLLDEWASEIPNFQGFSAEAGRAIYYDEQVVDGETISCATCHQDDPSEPTEHARTGKIYDAISPAVSPERLTEVREINKWLRRNCKDVYERECTAQEKGDFITFLYSL